MAGIHVASEVSIVRKERVVSLQEHGKALAWVAGRDTVVAALDAAAVPAFAEAHDLCITGPVRCCSCRDTSLCRLDFKQCDVKQSIFLYHVA